MAADTTSTQSAPAPTPAPGPGPGPQRVFVLGATGAIGSATVQALLRRGHEVVCFVRPRREAEADDARAARLSRLDGAEIRFGEVTDPAALAQEGFCGEHFDAVVSCMASRTGAPADAWAIDHEAHVHVLDAARRAGVEHFVLLSAICVQRPRLAFQHAKLAFEAKLAGSGLRSSIIRPTAYFKSLAGQIERVRRGKRFLIFGDGALTACKPISDEDLASYIADRLEDESTGTRILPIGGPGDAVTPREQGERLFALLGRPPRFRSVPVGLLDVVVGVLAVLGRVSPFLAAKAELARIGRYYATESMLVLDRATGRYDAAATPSTGTRTLFDFYADVLGGAPAPERGDHAVFSGEGSGAANWAPPWPPSEAPRPPDPDLDPGAAPGWAARGRISGLGDFPVRERPRRTAVWVGVGLAVVAAALVAAGAWLWTPDLSRRSLEARYLRSPHDLMDVAGVRLHVRDDGRRQAAALIMIHGFGSSLHTWEPWAPTLARDYRVVRFDLPGSGLSGPDPTGNYSDGRSVAVVSALMDRLHLTRATLIGNSIGGRIAWKFAAAHPDRVAKLVLISPDGFAGPGAAYGKAPAVPATTGLMRYVLPRAFLRASLKPAYGDPSALSAAAVARYHDLMRAPGVRDALLARMKQSVLVDPRPILRRIHAPVLLMWGAKDGMIPVANARDFMQALPDARLVTFPDLGHVPQEEAPLRSVQPLRAFLLEPGKSVCREVCKATPKRPPAGERP